MHMELRAIKFIQVKKQISILDEVLHNNEPVLLDFRVEPDENVLSNDCSRKRTT